MRRWLVGAAALAMTACAEEPAPSPAPDAPPAAAAAATIDRVTLLELGRTRTGFVLAAFGEAEGTGWRQARLRPLSGVAGPDGFVDFEFVALPPAAPGPGVQRLRADTPLAAEQLRGAAGVRVIARGGVVEGAF